MCKLCEKLTAEDRARLETDPGSWRSIANRLLAGATRAEAETFLGELRAAGIDVRREELDLTEPPELMPPSGN